MITLITQHIFWFFRVYPILAAKFDAICKAINCDLGIVWSFLDDLELLVSKSWFLFDS